MMCGDSRKPFLETSMDTRRWKWGEAGAFSALANEGSGSIL
jgi:hypothetical protein